MFFIIKICLYFFFIKKERMEFFVFKKTAWNLFIFKKPACIFFIKLKTACFLYLHGVVREKIVLFCVLSLSHLKSVLHWQIVNIGKFFNLHWGRQYLCDLVPSLFAREVSAAFSYPSPSSNLASDVCYFLIITMISMISLISMIQKSALHPPADKAVAPLSEVALLSGIPP